MLFDRDGNIKYANASACYTLGYDEHLILERAVMEVNPHISLLAWQQLWKKLEEGLFSEQDTDLMHRNGDLLAVTVQFQMVNVDKEKYALCLFDQALNGDSSFQVKKGELLGLAHETLNQSSDIIFWVQSDQSFIYFNDTACQLLGYTRDELDMLTIGNIYDGYDFFDNWEQFKKEQQRKLEHNISHKDGRSLPVEATITYLKLGESDCISITYRETSDLLNKEAQLEKAFEEIDVLRQKLKDEKTYLREELAGNYSFKNIITGSENYKQVLHQVGQVAQTDATVLIHGETGTGKELLARSIHQLSKREDEVMVKVNCAALPKNLIESELFGHEKGAFTDAHERKLGRFELADNGTLFLDEVGELPLELQAKLLRVLQEGEFERVGGTRVIKVDVRVVAATNRNLEKLVINKQFREDLYYRLNVFPIRNPPLRERKEDIPLLVQYFLEKYCKKMGCPLLKVSKSGMQNLQKYEFPGNVRELENIIERAIILSPDDKLNLNRVLSNLKQRPTKRKLQFPSLEEVQRNHIIEALKRTHWKITGENSASKLLKMNGKTLASRMRKLGIRREDFLEA